MSIRKEHVEAFDSALSSLQESVDLGRSLIDSKEDVAKKIATGFNTIQGIGQSYQAVQTAKAILNKGRNIRQSAKEALSKSKEDAKTTDTGSEETPETTPDENVTRAPQEVEMQDFPPASGESLDDLAPMRATMEQNAQPLAPTEAQNRMMDFDPEGDITDVVDTQATTAGEGVENAVTGTLETATTTATETATSTATAVTEGLEGAIAGTSEIPVLGEAVAILAGIGSAIASAFGDKTPPMPKVQQVGQDFSNSDEHSGDALSAY